MRFPMGRYSRLRRNVGFIGAAFLLGVSAQSAHAQIETTSSGPDSTSVTVYRDPSRGEGNINLDWLNGFALITEHRRIAVPAGESIIRSEEHTSELQSLMRISYAVFCWKKTRLYTQNIRSQNTTQICKMTHTTET